MATEVEMMVMKTMEMKVTQVTQVEMVIMKTVVMMKMVQMVHHKMI